MSQERVNSSLSERDGATEYFFGRYHMRSDDLVLRWGDQTVPLAPRVARTLLALLERAGRVVSKEELFETVWAGAAVEDANLSQNIYTLRRQFEAAEDASLIETLPRRGYRFAGRVRSERVGERATSRTIFSAAAILAGAAAFAVGGLALIFGAVPLAGRAPTGISAQPLGARQAYATGWLYYSDGTEDGLNTALAYFKRAAAIEPSSSLGDAGQAVAYAGLSDFYGGSPSGVSDGARADWFAHHVLAQRPASAAALAAKGYVEFDIDGDFAAAARDLKRAEELDPQNAQAYLWSGGVLLWQGNLAAARTQLQHATRIDSTLPTLDYLLAWDYYFSRDFGDAIAFARLAVSDPWTADEARLLLAAADEQAGKYGLAIAALTGLKSGPTDVIAASATRAHVYAMMGDRARAARELQTVERLTSRYRQRPLLTAVAYLANGRLDEAFAWLSRLSQFDRPILALDPRLDRVRHDPRFAQWLHG